MSILINQIKQSLAGLEPHIYRLNTSETNFVVDLKVGAVNISLDVHVILAGKEPEDMFTLHNIDTMINNINFHHEGSVPCRFADLRSVIEDLIADFKPIVKHGSADKNRLCQLGIAMSKFIKSCDSRRYYHFCSYTVDFGPVE